MQTFRTTTTKPVKPEPQPLTAAEMKFLAAKGIDPDCRRVEIQTRAWKPDEIAMIRLIAPKRFMQLSFYH